MKTHLDQSFFRSLILRSLLCATSSTTDAKAIHDGLHNLQRYVSPRRQNCNRGTTYPDWCRLGPLSSAISVHPLNKFRFLRQTLVK